ncbi:MAG: CBS domain-containing protein [Chloroflexota bacterium]
MVTMLIVILHDLDRFPDLLEAWKQIRVPGVTILQSVGGFQAEASIHRSGLGGLLSLFEQNQSSQRMLFSLIDDPEILELAIAEADRIVKGFDRPHSGILFTIPINRALGLQKWRKREQIEEAKVRREIVDRGEVNLLKWFEEDVKRLYGSEAITDWTSHRATPVSEIINLLTLKPTCVQMDTPLKEVFSRFLENPKIPLACVINKEKRLMGMISISKLAEAMMVPVMPEEFIKDSNDYQNALKFANPNETHLAADIMRDAIYIHLDDTLEDAFHHMKENNLPGLPVVDKLFRVKGYLTLLELLATCFPVESKKK